MSARCFCKHCGCELLASRGDECESRIGWCALIAARLHPNDVEAQTIADAVVEFTEWHNARVDARKTANAG